MSPEQHLGAKLNFSTDQFSFCLVAFEALFGSSAFAGDDYETLRDSVLGLAPRAMPHWAPLRLRQALLRGLNRDPGKRFPSMQELLLALKCSTRRKRWPYWAAAGAMACSAIVALGALWYQRAPSAAQGCDVKPASLWLAGK